MEITDFQLIDYIAQKNKPIILSTGMSSIDEVKKAIKVIRKYHNKLLLFYTVFQVIQLKKKIPTLTL